MNNGDSPNHFSLSLQAYLALEGVEKLIQEHSSATYPEGASVNLALILRCIQPEKVVAVLQDLIQKARQKRENSEDQLFKQVVAPILESLEIRAVDNYVGYKFRLAAPHHSAQVSKGGGTSRGSVAPVGEDGAAGVLLRVGINVWDEKQPEEDDNSKGAAN